VFGTRVGLNISGFAMLRGVRNMAAFVVKGLEKDKPKIFKGNGARESHVNIIIHMFVEAIRALQDGQPSAYLGALLNKSLVQVEVKSYLRQHDGESNADFEIRKLRDNYEKSDKRRKRLDFIIGQLKDEIKSKEATETKSAREKKALHEQTERLQESIDERCEAEKMKNARLERDIMEQKSKIVEVENDRNSGNHKRARVEDSLEEAQSKIAHLEHLEHDLMEEKKKSAQLEHDLMILIEQSKPVGQPTSLLNKVEDMNGRFEQTYRDLNRRFGQE
jgi:chromosome segregation ATPase